ncbi:MAG: hypothetical protein NTV46_22265 [Verrucomicrobia bacterium]|nr:hypothetical protein [Verrucomicrobiota bacterium]
MTVSTRIAAYITTAAREIGISEGLRSDGVDAKLGAVTRFTSVADAVESLQRATPT